MPIHGSLALRGRSDIDRLPNELLSVIFIFAIDQNCNDDSDSKPQMAVTTSPTTISHICHRWRQVALSTGRLWSKIILTFPTIPEQVTRTITWLARSKTYPLDILLDFRDPDWDWEETHGFQRSDMDAALSLLLPTAARWRSLELLTDTWAPIFAFLLRTRTLAPSLARLETLHLARCNAYFARKGQVFEPAALSEHIPLFGGSMAELPRLREVQLTGVHIDWTSPPLSNLTKLELKYQAADVMPSIAQFAHIVAGCPELEVLAIVGRGPQLTSPFTVVHGGSSSASAARTDASAGLQRSIKFANVTKFAFGFVDINYAIQLLSAFEFPALRELNLEDVSASLRQQSPDNATALFDCLVDDAFNHTVADRSAHHTPGVPNQTTTDTAALFLANGTSSVTASPSVDSATSTSTLSIPLAQLETLSLNSIFASQAAFARFFTACEGLGGLRLYEIVDGGLEALLPSIEPSPTEPTSEIKEVPLPRLHTLVARGVDEKLFNLVVSSRAEALKVATLEASTFAAADVEDDEDSDSDTDDGFLE